MGCITLIVTVAYSLPIGAVAMLVLFFFLRLPTPHGKLLDKLKRVDYAGT